MDKVLIDNESFNFISDWYEKNGIVVQRVPMVLQTYSLEWQLADITDGTAKGSLYYEAEWIDEAHVRFKTVMTRPNGSPFKVHFETHLDYECTNLLRVLREMERFGDPRPPEQTVPFPVGTTIFNTNEDEKEPQQRIARMVSYIHIYVMYFMANYEQELIEYVDKQVEKKPPKKKKKGKSKQTNKVVTTTVIRVNRYLREVKSGEKKLPRHNKKCQYAYGVKGHYRHYKSGKTVWIAPHQRNTLEQRVKREKQYKFNLKVGNKNDVRKCKDISEKKST